MICIKSMHVKSQQILISCIILSRQIAQSSSELATLATELQAIVGKFKI